MRTFVVTLITATAFAQDSFQVRDQWSINVESEAGEGQINFVIQNFINGTQDHYQHDQEVLADANVNLTESFGDGDIVEMWACFEGEGCRYFSWDAQSAKVYQSGFTSSTLDYLKDGQCNQPSDTENEQIALYQREQTREANWNRDYLDIRHVIWEDKEFVNGELVANSEASTGHDTDSGSSSTDSGSSSTDSSSSSTDQGSSSSSGSSSQGTLSREDFYQLMEQQAAEAYEQMSQEDKDFQDSINQSLREALGEEEWQRLQNDILEQQYQEYLSQE